MRTSRIPVSSCWLVLLALLCILDTVLAEQHPTIPRSNNRYTHYQTNSSTVDGEISPSSSSPELMLNVKSTTFYPPWNPSSKMSSKLIVSSTPWGKSSRCLVVGIPRTATGDLPVIIQAACTGYTPVSNMAPPPAIFGSSSHFLMVAALTGSERPAAYPH